MFSPHSKAVSKSVGRVAKSKSDHTVFGSVLEPFPDRNNCINMMKITFTRLNTHSSLEPFVLEELLQLLIDFYGAHDAFAYY